MEFDVDRGLVDRLLEDPAELMHQVRIMPVKGGSTLRLSGIRPDTLFGVLGLRNDDRLATINGFELSTPEKALEALARLRTADHLTVVVERGGKTMTIDYNIK
jgi:general secretion pathway protein C